MCTNSLPKITVVIPFYNDSATIGRAIKSAQVQTLPPAEIIIVDDASSRDECQSLDRIVEQLSSGLNIQVLRHSVNLGPSRARNFGWDRATGDLVAFLDSDDSWLPQKLEIQAEVMSETDFEIVGTKGELNGEPRFFDWDRVDRERRVDPRKQLLRNQFRTSSVMLRRQIPLRFRDDLRYSEDNDLWCRILLSGHKGAILNIPLTAYHKPARSTVGLSGNYLKMYLGQIDVYKSLRSSGYITLKWTALCLVSASFRFARRYILVLSDHLSTLLKNRKTSSV